jgi:hypothetical protein
MAEARALYRLKSPLSRFERNAEGQLRAVQHQTGDVIEPTEAELRDFGDRLEPAPDVPAPAPDAPTPATGLSPSAGPAPEPGPRARR